MKDIRVAVVVSKSPVNNTSNNIDGMVKWVKAAEKENAAVICFPEMNITGYSNSKDIIDVAAPVPGTATRDLLHFAESEKIVILAGIAEKDEKGRIFASHLVVTT